MKRADAKVKAALVLGLLFAYPIIRGYVDGTIDLSTAAVRGAIGLALAYGGVVLVVTVVSGYLPEPEEAPELDRAGGIDDAVLVEEGAEADQQ